MKFLKIIKLSSGILAVPFLYISCTKTTPQLADVQSDFKTSSMVQIFDATVKSTRNYVYVDGIPVSGAATAFGGVFPATAYAFKVTSGVHSFIIKDTLPATTQVPLVFAESFDIGKSYTIFTYDTISSPKQATVLNNIVVPADTTSRLRFANFIYNSSAMPNVDVYSFRRGTTTPVFTNVPTNQATEFVPYASALTDTLYVYATGTTSPLIIKKLVPTLVPQRSYTSTYSGSFRGTRDIVTFVTY